MSVTEDDDFAKHHSFVYPPMVFKNVRIADDSELLKPIVMLIYAITMDNPSSMPSARFDETRVHENGRQYELVANVPESVWIGNRAWNALRTVSPSRVKAIHVQPYYDAAMDTAYMRILVNVLSVMAPLGSSFDTFMRKDRSFLIPNRSATSSSSSNSLLTTQAPANAAAKLIAKETLVQDVRRACRSMTRLMEGYEFDRNFQSDLASMTMQWALPCEQMVDIDCVPMLMTQFAEHIKDVRVGLRVQRDGLAGYRPLMQIVVTISMVAHDQESAILVDTQTMVYFSDTPSHATQEPWYFEASGPHVDTAADTTDNASSPEGAKRRIVSTRASSRKGSGAENGAANQVKAPVVKTHSMAQLAKRPVDKKRKLPASFARQTADEEDSSSSSSSSSASSYSSFSRSVSESMDEDAKDSMDIPELPLPKKQQQLSLTDLHSDLPPSPQRTLRSKTTGFQSMRQRPAKRARYDDDDVAHTYDAPAALPRSNNTDASSSSWFATLTSFFG